MDPIQTGFAVVAALASVAALLVWWRRRPWTAALPVVVALVAATPLTRGLPDVVIAAGLLGVTGAAGWALWPRPTRRIPGGTEPGGTEPTTPDERAARGRDER